VSEELLDFARRAPRPFAKWSNYFEVYERHLARYRGTASRVLEIGVLRGGSLLMWADYFGPEARIVGIDINEECRQYATAGICVEIGSQADEAFLRGVNDRHGPFDVIIDDGGHRMGQQLTTFATLFPLMPVGGTFLCEDTHTSYWLRFGGGYRRRGTFIEFVKGLIDDLHVDHSTQRSHRPGPFARQIGGIHCYDSVVVIDRADRVPIVPENWGSMPDDVYPESVAPSWKRDALLTYNRILQRLRLASFRIGR
jgi:hypothetical protein